MNKLITIAVALASLLAQPFAEANRNELPDIGSSAGTIISASEEQKIGRMIMHQLRMSGDLVTDPEINEYIQALGERLSLYAHEGDLTFTFFAIDNPQLNAFALPGGFVGVHTGLLLATDNENELAAVLGHEIAHVSQKHLARSAEAAGQSGLIATAAMVAAILVGAASGANGDAIQAAVAVAQGSSMQQRINFTRANEYEADRVGIRYLADAGFDPLAMPSFFETMSRRAGGLGAHVPEYFRTHPVTSNRIAESRDRAIQFPAKRVPSSLNYSLIKARATVMAHDSALAAVKEFEARIDGHTSESSQANQYGYALALLKAGEAEHALPIVERLLKINENYVAFHTLAAQTNMAAGRSERGLTIFAKAQGLFPRNVPLTMAHASALMDADRPARAHELMLDLVNNMQYDQEQIRLLALAASAQGDDANAHYYMSEFHVLRGELELAIDQLNLALASPRMHDYQIARAEARKDEIKKYLPKKRRRARKEEPDRSDDGRRPR